MLKIIGAGLGRTGTLSLHLALQQLGYKSLHFDQERLNDVLDGSNAHPDFRRYDDVDAVLDLPAAYFFKELLDAYPAAQVVLTVRDTDAWWRSIERWFSVVRPVAPCPRLKHRLIEKFGLQRWLDGEPEGDEFRRKLRNCVYGSPRATEFLYKKKYEEHNRSVIAQIPSNRLLVMDVSAGDGWQKLCAFLGAPEPKTEFPHANRAAAAPLSRT
jgi:hypothetical protein